MKIKAILFDAGGVYLKGSFVNFVNKAYKVLDIRGKFKTSKEVTFDPDLNKGKVTIEKCFRDYFNIPISEYQMKKLIKLWNRTWVADKEMVKLVKLLKKNYILAIFSNSDKSNDKIYKKKGWYDYFVYLILSHEIGILKPDERIYKFVLRKLKLKPQQCLLIDDQKDCLITGEKIGMKTLLFKSSSKLKKDLKKMKII